MFQTENYAPYQATQYIQKRNELTDELFKGLYAIYEALAMRWDYLTDSQRRARQPLMDFILESFRHSNDSTILTDLSVRRDIVSLINETIKDNSIFNAEQKHDIEPFTNDKIWHDLQECIKNETRFQKYYEQTPAAVLTPKEKTLKDRPIFNPTKFTYKKTDDLQLEVKYIIPGREVEEAKKLIEPGITESQRLGYETQEFVLTPFENVRPDVDQLEQKLVNDFDLTGWNYFDVDGKDPTSRIAVLNALLKLADRKDIQVHFTAGPDEEKQLEQKIQQAKIRYDNRTNDKAEIQRLISEFREEVMQGAEEKDREEQSTAITEKITQLENKVASDENYKFQDEGNQRKFIAELRELGKQTNAIVSHKKNVKQEQLSDETKADVRILRDQFKQYSNALQNQPRDVLTEENIQISNLSRKILGSISGMDQRHPITKMLNYRIQTGIGGCFIDGIALVLKSLDEQKERAEKLIGEGYSNILDDNIASHKKNLERLNNIVESLQDLASKLPQFTNKERYLKQLSEAQERCKKQSESLDIDRARILAISSFNPLLKPQSITIEVIKENFPSELRSDPRVTAAIQLCLQSIINNPAIPGEIQNIFKGKTFHDQSVGFLNRLFTTPITAYAALRLLEDFYTKPAPQNADVEQVIKNLEVVTDLQPGEVGQLRQALRVKVLPAEVKVDLVVPHPAALSPVLEPAPAHPSISQNVLKPVMQVAHDVEPVIHFSTVLPPPALSLAPVSESSVDVKQIGNGLEQLTAKLTQLNQDIKNVATNYKGQTQASLKLQLTNLHDSLEQSHKAMDAQIFAIQGKYIVDENIFKQCDVVNNLLLQSDSQIKAAELLFQNAFAGLQKNIDGFQNDVKACDQSLANTVKLIENFSTSANPEADAKTIAASIGEVNKSIADAQQNLSQVWDPEEKKKDDEVFMKLKIKYDQFITSDAGQILNNNQFDKTIKENEAKLTHLSTLNTISADMAAINKIQELYQQKIAALSYLQTALNNYSGSSGQIVQQTFSQVIGQSHAKSAEYAIKLKDLSQQLEKLQKKELEQKLLAEQKKEAENLKILAQDVNQITLKISQTEELVGILKLEYSDKITQDPSKVKEFAAEFKQKVSAQKAVLQKIREHVDSNITGDSKDGLIKYLGRADTSVEKTQIGFDNIVNGVKAEINTLNESIQKVSQQYQQAIKLYQDVQKSIQRDPRTTSRGSEFPAISQAQSNASASIAIAGAGIVILEDDAKNLGAYAELQKLQKTALELQKTVDAEYETFNKKVFFWTEINNIESEMAALSTPKLDQEPKITIEFKPGDKRINLQIEAQEIKIGSIDAKQSAYQKIADNLEGIRNNLKYQDGLKLSGQPPTAKWPEEYKAFEHVKAFADFYLAKGQTALVEAYANLLKTALADFNLHFNALANSTEMSDSLSGLEKFYKENIQSKFEYIQNVLAKLGIVSDDPKDITEQLTKKIGPELSKKFMSAFTAKQELDQTYEKTHAELEAIQKKQEIAELKSTNEIKAKCINILQGFKNKDLKSELQAKLAAIQKSTNTNDFKIAKESADQWFSVYIATPRRELNSLLQQIGIDKIDKDSLKAFNNSFYTDEYKPIDQKIREVDAWNKIRTATNQKQQELEAKEADKQQVEQQINELTDGFKGLVRSASRGPDVHNLYKDNKQMNAAFEKLTKEYDAFNAKYESLIYNKYGLPLVALTDEKSKADAEYKKLKTKVDTANVLNECEVELKKITQAVQLNSAQVASYLILRKTLDVANVKKTESGITIEVNNREGEINKLIDKLHKLYIPATEFGGRLKCDTLLNKAYLLWDNNNINRVRGTGVYLFKQNVKPTITDQSIVDAANINERISDKLHRISASLASPISDLNTLKSNLAELKSVDKEIDENILLIDKITKKITDDEAKIAAEVNVSEEKGKVPEIKVAEAEVTSVSQLKDWCKKLNGEATEKLAKIQKEIDEENTQLAEIHKKYPAYQGSDLKTIKQLMKEKDEKAQKIAMELKNLESQVGKLAKDRENNAAVRKILNAEIEALKNKLRPIVAPTLVILQNNPNYKDYLEGEVLNVMGKTGEYKAFLSQVHVLDAEIQKLDYAETQLYALRLMNNLNNFGMTSERVNGFGDCYFDAIVLQLRKTYPDLQNRLFNLCLKHLQLLDAFRKDKNCPSEVSQKINTYLSDAKLDFSSDLNLAKTFNEKITKDALAASKNNPCSPEIMCLRNLVKFNFLEFSDYYTRKSFDTENLMNIDSPRVHGGQEEGIILSQVLHTSIITVRGDYENIPLSYINNPQATDIIYLANTMKPPHYDIAKIDIQNQQQSEALEKEKKSHVTMVNLQGEQDKPAMLAASRPDLGLKTVESEMKYVVSQPAPSAASTIT